MRSIFCSLVLFWLEIASAFACEHALNVHMEHSPPRVFVKDGILTHGMVLETVQAILAEAGCEMTWEALDVSTERALRNLQEGTYDVMVNTSDRPDRRQYGYFSKAYSVEVIGVFARAGEPLPTAKNLDDAYAANLRLIGPLQGWYGQSYERLRDPWIARKTLTPYKALQIGIQQFFADVPRGDLLLFDADVYAYLMQSQWHQPVIWAMPPVNIEPVHLLLSRKTVSEPTRKSIDAAIITLKNNGSLRRIEEKYRDPEILYLLDHYNQKHSDTGKAH